MWGWGWGWWWAWSMNNYKAPETKQLSNEISPTQKYKTQLWIAWAKITGVMRYWLDWAKEEKANFIENNKQQIYIVDEKEWIIIFMNKDWKNRLWKIIVSPDWADLVENRIIKIQKNPNISKSISGNYWYKNLKHIEWNIYSVNIFLNSDPVINTESNNFTAWQSFSKDIYIKYENWKFIPISEPQGRERSQDFQEYIDGGVMLPWLSPEKLEKWMEISARVLNNSKIPKTP